MVLLVPGAPAHLPELMQELPGRGWSSPFPEDCNQIPDVVQEDGQVHPLLPLWYAHVPCVYVSIANRALHCTVWECPHIPPAWQGKLTPNFSGPFPPFKTTV